MATINGGIGNDNLGDTAGNDSIFADAGDDQITVTLGLDSADGWTGNDTLVINYGSATQNTDVDGSFGQAFVDDNGGGTFVSSGRRVGFIRVEHLNVTTGSGNDRLEGIGNSSDTLDGGAGVDEWEDFFGAVLTGMSVNMQSVSSAGGQSFADGTTVRNLEIADLDLT